MRVPRLGARLHRSEPAAKVKSPIRKSSVARGGQQSSPNHHRLASTSVYASTVHWSPESEAWKSFPMEGRATLTMVTSMPTMSRLMEQIAGPRCVPPAQLTRSRRFCYEWF